VIGAVDRDELRWTIYQALYPGCVASGSAPVGGDRSAAAADAVADWIESGQHPATSDAPTQGLLL